ncbi:MAG TPA: hypothetical protein EYN67_02135, partial [Flavobacteriales bacterium]|nr:hypothetical protein [Flavobacteriales bacterium]
MNAKNAAEMAELMRDMLHTTLRELGPAKKAKALKSIKTKGWFGKEALTVKNISAQHDKMEFLFELMDGFKDNGIWWRTAYKPIADAANQELEMQEQYITNLEAIFDKYYTKKERKTWLESVDTGFDIEIDKSNIIAMALNYGNQYNKEAMYEGVEHYEGWSINRFDVDKILNDQMQAKDWQAVQEIWDLINELKPAVAKQQKQLTGVVPKMVEATPFTNKHGSFRGGYFPIVFDKEKGQLAKDRADRSDTEDLMETTWRFPMTRHGHTKERTNSAKQFIQLDINIISRHIMSVIHDVNFRVPVMEINRLMKKSEIRDNIVAYAGQEGYDQIKPWLQAIANDVIVQEDAVQDWLRKGRHSASIVAMGMKLSTALMQPFGYTQSIVYLGRKWAFNGFKYYSAHPIQAKREAFAKSAFLRNRSKTFDRDVRDVLRRLTGQDNKLKKIQEQQ